MNHQENHNLPPPLPQPPSTEPNHATTETPSPSASWSNDKNIWYTNSFLNSKTKTNSQHRRNSSHQHGSSNKNPTTDNYNSVGTPSNQLGDQQIDAADVSVASSSAAIGQPTSSTVIGHYELKKTLGKGNFSTVKLAQHRITQHSVAIKIVKTSTLSEDNLMKINREIEVLKKIGKQNHIVRLYQVIKTKRYFMLVTEYCANGELYDYIVEKGRLNEPQASNYFLQILSALEYLHDHNIVHRDLKAENLLLTDDFKTVKIADFGFANYYKHDKLLSTWCGSPPYAAPELFKGLHYVGPPVDIWSLGVILYVLVCGSLPFDGHNLVFLKSRVLSGKFKVPFFMSTECESLIRGMLRLDPEKRLNIRQIRSHCWTMKHSNSLGRRDTITENTKNMSSLVYMDTNSSSRLLNAAENQTKPINTNVQVFDKNNSNRGQSLDLEDDKKKEPNTDSIVEDVSMLSLVSSNDGKIKTNKICSSSKDSKLQNFVDTEMANAVSNMSIDSNNSSMSFSQSIEPSNNNLGPTGASTRMMSSRAESIPPRNGILSKENSIDDQIIDFMVENLKVAESQSSIRQSIANDKYDDLQAMYKLIKDEPKILYDSQIQKKFKIPSLPVIFSKKQMNSKKPSITTGFFNIQTPEDTVSSNTAFLNDNNDPTKLIDNKREQVSTVDKNSNTIQTKPMSMVTKPSDSSNVKIGFQEHRGSEDQTWIEPPQLFLTPPAESRTQTCDQKFVTSNQDSKAVDDNSPTSIQFGRNNYTPFSGLARRSFDSTMQQIVDPSVEIPGFCNNKLTLTNCTQQSLWDSSILDTLGVSTPSHRNQSNTSPLNFEPNNSYMSSYGNTSKHEVADENSLDKQNIAQITTNLPQIGQIFSANINQNMLLAHLNSLALSAAVTQSGVLSQSNTEGLQAVSPIKFTPNNLINQNYANINNLQNALTNVCPPNLSLLDPNCLTSGLERRASDGQASYSSLTTKTTQTSETSTNSIDNRELITSNNILSSSSNQVSSDFNGQQKRISAVASYDPGSVNTTGSNHSIEYNQNVINKPFNTYRSTNYSQQQIINNSDNKPPETQMSPLDLTQNSKGGHAIKTPPIKLEAQYLPNQIGKSQNQRSLSTTSGSIVFNHLPSSASTSPRNSLFVSNAHNNIHAQSCQTSPSTVSLTGGGPGHLLNRRKRHSLETESRSHYCPHHHHHNHHQQPYQNLPGQLNQYGLNLNFTNTNDSNWVQKPQYPANSHIGQLRNFAQTFNYNKLIKKQSSPAGWIETSSATWQASDTNTKDNNIIDGKEQKDTEIDRTRKG